MPFSFRRFRLSRSSGYTFERALTSVQSRFQANVNDIVEPRSVSTLLSPTLLSYKSSNLPRVCLERVAGCFLFSFPKLATDRVKRSNDR